MENDFYYGEKENFKIHPEVWLRTLLAIAGDKEKKAEALQEMVQKTGCSLEEAKEIMAATISILLNQTRSN